MSSHSVKEMDYNDLIRDYGGLNVLIIDDQIKFSDKNNKIVFEYARKNFPKKIWKIIIIDSGEAALYGINFPCNKNQT